MSAEPHLAGPPGSHTDHQVQNELRLRQCVESSRFEYTSVLHTVRVFLQGHGHGDADWGGQRGGEGKRPLPEQQELVERPR